MINAFLAPDHRWCPLAGGLIKEEEEFAPWVITGVTTFNDDGSQDYARHLEMTITKINLKKTKNLNY